MSKKFKILYLILFVLIFSFSYSSLLYPETYESISDSMDKTVVITIRGEVVVFPYYKIQEYKFADRISEGEIVDAIFLRKATNSMIYAYIPIMAELVKAYVPLEFREEFKYIGYSTGVEIKLIKQRGGGCEWVVVFAGYRVKKGYMYREREVVKTPKDVMKTIEVETKEVGKVEWDGGITPILPEYQEEVVITTSSDLPSGTEEVAYSKTLEADGGEAPYTWSLVSGSLPDGISLSSNGVISGTPAVGSHGDYTFTVKVNDRKDRTARKEFNLTITINVAELVITTDSVLPEGTYGEAYSKTLEATGGETPYTWSVISGIMPEGLTLNSSSGEISGTPTQLGDFTFKIQVEDSRELPNRTSKEFTLKISGTRVVDWHKLGSDGFGEPNNTYLLSMVTYNEKIYTGTGSTVQGCQIFRGMVDFFDRVVTDGFSDPNNLRATSLVVFNGSIYAGTMNNVSGGEVWRSSTGDTNSWSQTNIDGFDDNQNKVIMSFAVFNSYIYAGTDNTVNSCEVWRSSDGSAWSPVVGPAPAVVPNGFMNVNTNTAAMSMAVFGGYLYAGTANTANGCEIWRSSNGTAWENVVSGGFGDSNNKNVLCMTVFGSYIYAGTLNATNGGKIYRSSTGNLGSWEDSGFTPTSSNPGIYSMAVFTNYLYAGSSNLTSGCHVWRSLGGADWTKASTDGFGDSNNTVVNVMLAFGDFIYAGTKNTSSGCELWRYGYETHDPHITGRVYNSETGETGETVNDCYISLYRNSDNNLMGTVYSGDYSFNVDDGSYYLRVEKEGYKFPSEVVESKTAGDHGEVFFAGEDTMVIDLPVDSGYPLQVEKTSNKKEAVKGDIITFNIAIENLNDIPYGNIEIRDQIRSGFKLVEDSTYFGDAKIEDPERSDHDRNGYKFTVGTIPANTVLNLSYQVRTRTGIAYGIYETTALAWDSYRNWRMSLDSDCAVRIIEDPLFTRGTIIGKVIPSPQGGEGVRSTGAGTRPSLWGEGAIQQDKGIDLTGVRIVMENGVVVETDRYGRYHIAGVKAGTHLLKIDESTLPSGYEVGSENPYIVHVSEGMIHKVNFELSEKEDKDEVSEEIGESKFFIVGLGEAIVRNVETNGNLEMTENDDSYDEGIHLDGKLAFYLKGKVRGKYLITASLDTSRRGGIGSYAERASGETKLFTNLDPDKYYPVYGDASKIDYSANDTQDVLYVLIEWDESFIKYGSFHTELPLYNRTLHGGIVNYVSTGKTRFKEPKTTLNAFAADARQIPAHDEFLGTGGSLYYIRHRNAVEGSEKISIVVKDQLTQQVLGRRILEEELDYTIDYDSGRILLKRPLSMVGYRYDDLIISNDMLSGARAYLVVDYEYITNEVFHRDALGGKVGQWLGDNIKVEGTYVSQENETSHYDIKGVGTTLMVNEETEITATYNQSRNTQTGGSISADGGLNFYDQEDNYAQDKDGNAWGLAGKTKIFGNTFVDAGYDYQDPYFSATNTLSTSGTKRLTAGIITHLTEQLKLGIKHYTQIILENTEILSSLTGDNNTHTTTSFADWTPGKWDFRGEYQHQIVTHMIENYIYMGRQQLRDNNMAGLRVGYKVNENFHPYMGGQATLTGSTNNQFFAGTELEIMENVKLDVKETIGNMGNSTLLGVRAKNEGEGEFYTNLSVGNNDQFGSYTTSSYGKRKELSPSSSLYIQHDYSSYQEGVLEGEVIGYENKLTDTVFFGTSYERSYIYRDPQVINRDSVSIKFGCLDIDVLDWSTKIEYRDDKEAAQTTRSIFTENNIIWHIVEGLDVIGKGNYSISKGINTDENEAEFKELGFGLAYRPVSWDKLNLLCKYARMEDFGPINRIEDFPFEDNIRKDVYAIEGTYDICRYLQLAGKIAYRLQSEKVGPRDWTESDTYLYIGRVNFHITKAWDIGVEYRTLVNDQIEDSKSGYLIEIDREIGRYATLGFGYNFTDYDDDLTNNDDWDAKGWFARVVGKY